MTKRSRGWVEGIVDIANEHIKITYGDERFPVALLAPDQSIGFIVQFVCARKRDPFTLKMLKEVRRDLNYYLVELGEPDPWLYAIYHCSTASNLYSQVHWSFYPQAQAGAVASND